MSIPKFLYGNNVQLICVADISCFFTELKEYLKSLFEVEIEDIAWKVTQHRIDVCWNFQVGDQVGEYIMQLAKSKLQHKNTVLYNHNQTVEFRNKSKAIVFYDKYVQCVADKEHPDIVETAKGILRLEIRPSDADIRKYTSDFLAVKLLTYEFFQYIISRELPQCQQPIPLDQMFSLSWLQSNSDKLMDIEKLLGFQFLITVLGESVVKELYQAATYSKRKKQLRDIDFQYSAQLKPLLIDERMVSQIGSHPQTHAC
ncbi:hypothetical protein D3C74_219400 [compost metagenome]